MGVEDARDSASRVNKIARLPPVPADMSLDRAQASIAFWLNIIMLRSFCVIIVSVMTVGYCSADGVQLTETDSGKTNSVKFGTEIVIILEGNPTTGYEWMVMSFSTNKLQKIGDTRYRPAEQHDKHLRVGVGGHFVFKFKTIESGRGDLKLVYRRSWETTACDKVYSVVIDVK